MLTERSSIRVAWVLGLVLVAAALARLVPVCAAQFAAPFDLISEGPHLGTVQAIQRGYDIYARRSYLDLPFFMTPYTPLYHAIVAALPQRATNPFFTGRVVAAVFMVAAAASLFAVAGRRRSALVPSALAVFFLIHSVTGNTAYLRSDTLALCLSVWAVVLASRARSTRAMLAAGATCALAVAAKQSFLSATLACGIVLLLTAPRRLVPFVVGGTAVGAALAVAATAVWGPEFWLAVTIPMTDYPRDIESFFVHWRMMFAQPLFIFLIATAVIVTILVSVRRPAALLATPFFAYALVSWIVQTAVMTGIGAENHNLIEPVLATLLWIIVADRALSDAFRVGVVRGLVLAALIVAAARELRSANPSRYSYTNAAHTAAYVRARDDVNAALRAMRIDHGRMLNLKNSQVVHDYVGDFAVNDLWMYVTVLWHSRPETVDRLVDAINRQEFDAVILSPGIFTAAHDVGDHPWVRIVHAVFARYRLAYHGTEVNVLTRRDLPAS